MTLLRSINHSPSQVQHNQYQLASQGYQNPYNGFNIFVGAGVAQMSMGLNMNYNNSMAITTESQTIEMKVGENGKCYIAEIDKRNEPLIDTKQCHRLLNFHKQNPNLLSCTKGETYEKLRSILMDTKRLTPTGKLAAETLSGQFINNFGKTTELIHQSVQVLKDCTNQGLASFVLDNKLFEKKVRIIDSPVSEGHGP